VKIWVSSALVNADWKISSEDAGTFKTFIYTKNCNCLVRKKVGGGANRKRAHTKKGGERGGSGNLQYVYIDFLSKNLDKCMLADSKSDIALASKQRAIMGRNCEF
jgi:hypothetical protein